MRPIDADALFEHKVYAETPTISGDFVPGFAIDNAPTLNVVPVERGRKIIETPCLPGDVVYYSEFDVDTESRFVRAMEVKSVEIEEDGLAVWCDDALGHERFVLDDFGYCVFADRREAIKVCAE